MASGAEYRIGEFAALTGVTVKALRHYHDAGVLVPAVTDPRSGYRFYNANQLAELHRILELTGLGLTLREIRGLVDETFAANAVRIALMKARSRAADDLSLRQDQLRRIEARLAAPAQTPHSYVIKSIPRWRVSALREIVHSFGDAEGLLDELSVGLRGSDTERALRGTIWHDCGKRPDAVIDCEVMIAATAVRPGRGARGESLDLPSTRVLSILHRGEDSTTSEAYAAGWRWLDGGGFHLSGPVREWYLPSTPDGSAITEVQFPIREVSQP